MAETTPPGPPRPFRPLPGGPSAPAGKGDGPLVTEGMQAQRRDLERRRREWRREQEMLKEEAEEGWARIWKIVVWIVVLAGVAYGYWRIQAVYQNRWPISLVWGAVAFFLAAGIGWMLWFVNKSDM